MILPCKNGSPLTMWKWYWLLRYTFFISLTWVHYCGLLLSSCRFSLFWLLGNLLLYITSYELIWPSVHTYVIFMVKALLWQVVVLCANLIINKNGQWNNLVPLGFKAVNWDDSVCGYTDFSRLSKWKHKRW